MISKDIYQLEKMSRNLLCEHYKKFSLLNRAGGGGEGGFQVYLSSSKN